MKPDNALGSLIGMTSLSIRNEMNKQFRLKGYDITVDHWTILSILINKEGLSQLEISAIAHKDKTNITRILKLMEKRELITRKQNDNDGRFYNVYLTKKGRTMQRDLIPIAHKVTAKFSKGLSEKRTNELIKDLQIIYNNLQDNKDFQ